MAMASFPTWQPNWQHLIEYIWEKPAQNDDYEHHLHVLGQRYAPSKLPEQPEADKLGELKSFIDRIASEGPRGGLWKKQDAPESSLWPSDFLEDVQTRIWFTYRSGFPVIPKAEDGPSPLTLGSIFRGTLDISTMSEGFSTDAGWGCMIRTSQSLLANALMSLHVGREWRYKAGDTSREFQTHWDIVKWFADVPSAPFSIQRIVDYGSHNCNKKPGEWFGPSAAAQSIVHLCNEAYSQCRLKTYLTDSNGDIYEDEFLRLCCVDGQFVPVLILSGIRLGVSNVNSVYWKFLKNLLDLPQSVGIAGGRPSSSHYFFGYQGDSLFYLDPHMPQKALLLDEEDTLLQETFLPTVHTAQIRKLHLAEMDPSMLIGLLITSQADYEAFKEAIAAFSATERFINVYPRRPDLMSRGSAGSELVDECDFVDLGENSAPVPENAVLTDPEESPRDLAHYRKFSLPVIVDRSDALGKEIEFDKDASMIDQNEATEKFEEIERTEVRRDELEVVGKSE